MGYRRARGGHQDTEYRQCTHSLERFDSAAPLRHPKGSNATSCSVLSTASYFRSNALALFLLLP